MKKKSKQIMLPAPKEIPKRLAPTGPTLRELFLKSGNLCAIPGCQRLMMNADGLFIGIVCHIEAALTEGERFNVDMSNEDRRHVSNLMLLCHEHHVETDDEEKFPVPVMQKIKADHENRFSDPAKAILSKIADWTLQTTSTHPVNLNKLNSVLGWKNSAQELNEVRKDLLKFIDRLQEVPAGSRRVLSLIAARRYRKLEKLPRRNRFSEFNLPLDDVQAALSMSNEEFGTHIKILSHHNLAEVENPFGEGYEVELRSGMDWPIWDDLPQFAKEIKIDLSQFVEELQFHHFDD